MLSCGHKTHRLVGLAVALLALALPSAASAAETVYVSSGTLTYSNTPGDVDHVTVADGGASYPGLYRVSEPNTPTAFAGVGCTQLGLGEAVCSGSVSAVSVSTTSGDDRVTIDVGLPATINGLTEHDVLTGGSATTTSTAASTTTPCTAAAASTG